MLTESRSSSSSACIGASCAVEMPELDPLALLPAGLFELLWSSSCISLYSLR